MAETIFVDICVLKSNPSRGTQENVRTLVRLEQFAPSWFQDSDVAYPSLMISNAVKILLHTVQTKNKEQKSHKTNDQGLHKIKK